MTQDNTVAVVGGGLAGSLCALILKKRGYDVSLYERWDDIRTVDLPGGRSINLILTARGMRALNVDGLDGVKDELLALSVPVLGRMMHSVKGELTYTAYGADDTECNYAISRTELNKHLLSRAEEAGVKCFFRQKLQDLNVDETTGHVTLTFVDEVDKDNETVVERTHRHVIGCDGGGSAVRRNMKTKFESTSNDEVLDHIYKEMKFPSGENSQYVMEKDSLHIWPRGDHMLMALANLTGGSFTGTIYLRKDLNEKLNNGSDQEIMDFFQEFYPDSIPLLGGKKGIIDSWRANLDGLLGTVWCNGWVKGDSVLMMGDAAHAIVPFFGQGCNSGFEDCLYLDKLMKKHKGLNKGLFSEFYSCRKPAADAIATMALENFVEMRDLVGDEQFILRKRIEAKLMKDFSGRFRSRYPMVVYSSIPYNVVYELGQVIDTIIDKLVLKEEGKAIANADDIDMALAETLIDTTFKNALQKHGVDLTENWHDF